MIFKILFYTADALLGFRYHLILHMLFKFQIKDIFALKDDAKLYQTKHEEPLVYFCGAKLIFNSMVTIKIDKSESKRIMGS